MNLPSKVPSNRAPKKFEASAPKNENSTAVIDRGKICRGGLVRAPFQTSVPEPVELEKRTILVVSHETELRSLLRSYLEHVGFGVASCGDVWRALQAIDAGVDLLLVDLQTLADMPAAADELATRCAALPVIALFMPGSPEADRRQFQERGWMLLPKPILLPQLLGSVHRVFELARSA